MASSVPTIFSRDRRDRRSIRSRQRQSAPDVARFVADEIAEDMIDRLSFVRLVPKRSLLIGSSHPSLQEHLASGKLHVLPDLDLEQPYPSSDYDFIGCVGVLDAVNDLPGALIHMRSALTPGGLAIASFIGGASLPNLRRAILAAEPVRPSARMHPLVDPRAAPGLLQRAGWKDPVVDTHTLKVRYSSLDRLVHDLRDQALGSALADVPPPLGKAALARARQAFLESADADGKVTELFEIVTLTGRRSLAGT